MKRIVFGAVIVIGVVGIIFPFFYPSFAGEKEELILKRELFRERLQRIILEFTLTQKDLAATEAALIKIEKPKEEKK